MDLNQLISKFKETVKEFQYQVVISEAGTVVSVGDGIAFVSGLSEAMNQELLLFPGGIRGLVLNLDQEELGCVLLGPDEGIKAGDQVIRTGKVIEVPVGEVMLGRVVNALGQPLDGQGPVLTDRFRYIETQAPPLVDRVPVKTPLETGIKIIDLLLPLGRGQRELIIGDRKTGKTALAVDTVINQKDKDVICIYTFIGQKMSTIASVVDIFKRYDALNNTVVVVASADASPAMLYLAPYAACAVAEEFAYQGKDVLIIYDDLSKHAVAYRELSLLLHRPPGREAYPGDIFYLHARLLERAAKLGEELGGGSLSAIPIIETKAGNIAAYIPTNLISITDGQIYLDSKLFNAGFKPAIDIGISVSRVGGQAQTSAMREVSAHLRLDLAQYEELEIFAKFGAELEKTTLAKIKRGQRLKEILKQDQHLPVPEEHQILIIAAANLGAVDDIPVSKVKEFEAELIKYVAEKHPFVFQELKEKKKIDESLEKSLGKIISDFKTEFIKNV